MDKIVVCKTGANMKTDKLEAMAKECHLEYTFAQRCFADMIKAEIIRQAEDVKSLHESDGLDVAYKTPSSTLATLVDRIKRI